MSKRYLVGGVGFAIIIQWFVPLRWMWIAYAVSVALLLMLPFLLIVSRSAVMKENPPMARIKNSRAWSTFTFNTNGKKAYVLMKRALENGWWQPPMGFQAQWDDAHCILHANCTQAEFRAWSAQAGAGSNSLGKYVAKQDCHITPPASNTPPPRQANLF